MQKMQVPFSKHAENKKHRPIHKHFSPTQAHEKRNNKIRQMEHEGKLKKKKVKSTAFFG